MPTLDVNDAFDPSFRYVYRHTGVEIINQLGRAPSRYVELRGVAINHQMIATSARNVYEQIDHHLHRTTRDRHPHDA
jgi:hypothetical protein